MTTEAQTEQPKKYALVEKMGHVSIVGSYQDITFLGGPAIEITTLTDPPIVHVISNRETLYGFTPCTKAQAEYLVKCGRGGSLTHQLEAPKIIEPPPGWNDNDNPGDMSSPSYDGHSDPNDMHDRDQDRDRFADQDEYDDGSTPTVDEGYYSHRRSSLRTLGFQQPSIDRIDELPIGIYLATSWRNEHQATVLKALLDAGFWVYDFKNPRPDNKGFAWSAIDPNWQQWTPEQFREAMEHPLAKQGYAYDIGACMRAEICVMVQPCGRSAHLELGTFIGQRKECYVLLAPNQEPELMIQGASLHTSIVTLIQQIKSDLEIPF